MKITVEIHRDEQGRPSILDVKMGRKKLRAEVMATDRLGHASNVVLTGSRRSLPDFGDLLSFFDGHIARIDVIDLIELINKITEITTIKVIESMPTLNVIAVGSEGTALKQATAGAGAWNDPDGFTETVWEDEAKAYDNNTATYAYIGKSAIGWTEYLELTIVAAVKSNKLRFRTQSEPEFTLIDVDVKRNGSWVNVYEGGFVTGSYIEKTFAEGDVDGVRIRFYNSEAWKSDARVNEVDVWNVPTTGGELEIVDVTPP